MVEVLISGGGPAGACAAIVLARHGARVLLVERATFPRAKLCGDTLNPGAIACLRDLGVADDALRASLPLRGMVVEGEGVEVRADYPAGLAGAAIARRDLDAALLEAASAAGAKVQTGVRVVAPMLDEGARETVRGAVLDVSGSQVRMPAGVTIAADGRRSPLALALELSRHPPAPRRWAIGAYFEGVDGLGPRGEMHVRRDRYIGLAPLPGGLTNACVVAPGQPEMRAPREFLQRTLARDPVLARRFARAKLTTGVTSLGPLAVDATRAGVPGLLLAGDAAGFVDPMTGDGLRLAIRGGVLAAHTALAMLEQPHLRGEERLAQLRSREFGHKLRLNRLLRLLVGHSAGVRGGAVAARLVPALVRHLVVLAGDVNVARQVWRTPAGAAP